jgi:hypothetical protein
MAMCCPALKALVMAPSDACHPGANKNQAKEECREAFQSYCERKIAALSQWQAAFGRQEEW